MTTIASSNYKSSIESSAHTFSASQGMGRLLGMLYLVLAIVGMFSVMAVESLTVAGDASATFTKISDSLGLFRISLVTWIVIVMVDVIIAMLFFVVLERNNRELSLVAAAFRISYAVILGEVLLKLFSAYFMVTDSDHQIGMDAIQLQSQVYDSMITFGDGFLLALIFFGVYLVALGILLYRSGHVPGVLGVLLAVAGVGYVVDSLGNFFITDYSSVVTMIILTPAILGEFGLTGWLLVKGFRKPVPVLD